MVKQHRPGSSGEGRGGRPARAWGSVGPLMWLALLAALALPARRAAAMPLHDLDASPHSRALSFEIFEDTGGQLRPEQVMAPAAPLPFRPTLGPKTGTARDVVLWLRLSLRLQPGAPRSRVLLVHALFPFWDRVDLYQPEYDAASALRALPPPGRSGRHLLLSERALADYRSGFLLTLPGERASSADPVGQILYLRLHKLEPTTWSYLQQNLQLSERPVETYSQERQNLFFTQGLYLGVMLIMIIYNLAIFVSARESAYLAFSYLLFAFGFFFAHVKGILFEVVGVSARLMTIYLRGVPLGVALIASGVSWFAISYLDLRRAQRRMFWVLSLLSGLLVITLIGCLLSPFLRTYLHFINYVVIPVPLLILIAGVRRVFEGYRPAITFMASSVITLFSAIVQNLCYVQVIKNQFLTDYSLQAGSLVMVTLLASGLAERMRLARRQAEEKEKTERILHNVLPPSIAQRLKSCETTIAERYEEVTVLFADIVGFTELSARLSPEVLVQSLNRVFSRFDALSRRLRLEKIKTIGDCYMVVAGLPDPLPDQAERMAKMALAMRDSVREISAELTFPDGFVPELRLRIGIHAGPAVAGVIGTEKFAYDLWGDTVNLASRMESHGEPGAIHCSATVYERLRQRYTFRERGEIPIKGKGRLTTYFLLDGPRLDPA
jgi:class 3 adenylate cyclase